MQRFTARNVRQCEWNGRQCRQGTATAGSAALPLPAAAAGQAGIRVDSSAPTCALFGCFQLPLHVADVIKQVQVTALPPSLPLKVHPVRRGAHTHQLHVLLYLRAQRLERLQCKKGELLLNTPVALGLV